jgi:hypothetical protein
MGAGPVRSAACGIQLTADCELLRSIAQLVVVLEQVYLVRGLDGCTGRARAASLRRRQVGALDAARGRPRLRGSGGLLLGRPGGRPRGCSDRRRRSCPPGRVGDGARESRPGPRERRERPAACRTSGIRPCRPLARGCQPPGSRRYPRDSKGERTRSKPIPRLQGNSPLSRKGSVNWAGSRDR